LQSNRLTAGQIDWFVTGKMKSERDTLYTDLKTACFPQQHAPPLRMNVVNILQHLPLLYGKWLKLLKRI
jgi:hypothetical protein